MMNKESLSRPLTGTEAVAKVRDLLNAAGMPRVSTLTGGEMTGWTRNAGDTGFSICPRRDGFLTWHVVISGRLHLEYMECSRDGCRHHEPLNAETLYPRIAGAFAAIGMPNAKVSLAGYQTHWDDDVSFNIDTAHPQWLEAVHFRACY